MRSEWALGLGFEALGPELWCWDLWALDVGLWLSGAGLWNAGILCLGVIWEAADGFRGPARLHVLNYFVFVRLFSC